MIKYCKMRLVQVIETVNSTSIPKMLRQIIYLNREAVPVEKDLTDLRQLDYSSQESDERFTEITAEKIGRQSLSYPVESRHLKAHQYLKSGYRGFAMVKGNAVTGDIWYAASNNSKKGPVHSDLTWLGINCEENQAYTFDMYVNPGKRGGNLAVMLQNKALNELHKLGFTKAYGYYWADNIPALWVHRTLKWKELRRVKVSRFIFFKKAVS